MTPGRSIETDWRSVKIRYSQVQSLFTQRGLPRGALHLGVVNPPAQKTQADNGEEPEKEGAAENRANISRVLPGMDISQDRRQTGHDRKWDEERHKRQPHDDGIDQIRNHAKPEPRVLHWGSRIHYWRCRWRGSRVSIGAIASRQGRGRTGSHWQACVRRCRG